MRTDDLLLVSWARAIARTGEAQTIREGANLTRAEVGEACGVKGDSVRQWEQGVRVPQGQAALRYARLLDQLAQRAPKAVVA